MGLCLAFFTACAFLIILVMWVMDALPITSWRRNNFAVFMLLLTLAACFAFFIKLEPWLIAHAY